MSAILAIESEFLKLGYQAEALFRDYSFADVLVASGEERQVDLAVFTQVPESYRSAAFGVVTGENTEQTVSSRRALGAPILLSIDGQQVGVWKVAADKPSRLLETVSLDDLSALFSRYGERWNPQSIHRAKAFGSSRAAYQIDFVDLGLMTAIEHEIEEKLDVLLRKIVTELLAVVQSGFEDSVFRITFRLLAAKILLDRKHSAATGWMDASVTDVLKDIERYYSLHHLPQITRIPMPQTSLEKAWRSLCAAISFRNISADSLAFIYENTLVTTDTRKRFGTHSTPRALAEYVLSQLNIEKFDPAELTVTEPFAGAGIFLVAALRQMRDLLPEHWTAEQRHEFLVPKIKGAEIDTFACEVATLSLILADYPNANGWAIKERDLFDVKSFEEVTDGASIILCNPPWEEFSQEERSTYPDITSISVSKPMAVLEKILDVNPLGFGFVLPHGFLRQKQYTSLRQAVADQYSTIKLTSLPDRIFQQAGFETAVLVATDRKQNRGEGAVDISCFEVFDSDRLAFLESGATSTERRSSKSVAKGELWIGELDLLWESLQEHKQLGEIAEIYRGLKWFSQKDGYSDTQQPDFKKGVFQSGRSLRQFSVQKLAYVNTDPTKLYSPTPVSRDWHLPKLLVNTARLSRGKWRLAAYFDNAGLVPSQAFFGVWVKDDQYPLEAIEAILNGPVGNAFVAEKMTNQHVTNDLLKKLPLPKPDRLQEVVQSVRRYKAHLQQSSKNTLALHEEWNSSLQRLLIAVDAAVLKAYDLPPYIERQLLEYFRGENRAKILCHEFSEWIPEDFTANIPLHDYIGSLVEKNRGAWAVDSFKEGPPQETALMDRFLN